MILGFFHSLNKQSSTAVGQALSCPDAQLTEWTKQSPCPPSGSHPRIGGGRVPQSFTTHDPWANVEFPQPAPALLSTISTWNVYFYMPKSCLSYKIQLQGHLSRSFCQLLPTEGQPGLSTLHLLQLVGCNVRHEVLPCKHLLCYNH